MVLYGILWSFIAEYRLFSRSQIQIQLVKNKSTPIATNSFKKEVYIKSFLSDKSLW